MDISTLNKLKEPFSLRFISWRAGKIDEAAGLAEALPYVDARAVQIRLDDVLGPTNWSVRFTEVIAGNRLVAVRCTLALRVEGVWVEKEDAAPVSPRDDSSAEFALKGAYSDALKRAAVQWGVARYLYDYHRQWHPVDKRRNFLKAPTLPDELVLPHERSMQHAQEQPNVAPAKVEPPQDNPANKAGAPLGESSANVGARQAVAHESTPQKADDKAKPKAHEPETQPAASSSSSSAQAPDDTGVCYPQGLSEVQDAFVKDVLARIGKVKPHVLRSYVMGPKGTEKLTPEARAYILAKLEESEAAA